MTPEATARPRLRPDLRVIGLDGEALVVDEAEAAVHHVDGLGALVLGWLDGDTSVEELAGDVAEVFEVDRSTVASQLTTFVERLEANGLLTTSLLRPVEAPLRPGYLVDPPAP